MFFLYLPGLYALELSGEEKAWLENHSTINYAPAPKYPPVEFFDEEGSISGITSDFLAIISERSGLNFKILKYRTWSDVVADTKLKKVDAWGCAAKNDERLKYLTFPDPYIYFPSVIVVKDHISEDYTLTDLKNKKVVVVNNYATHRYMEKNYPGYNLVVVTDIPSGLRMVSIGSADAMIVTNAVASYYIEKTGISNLRVAGVLNESDLDLHLGFAVRKDWPELKSIIQKSLDSIDEKTKKEIFRKWISLKSSGFKLTRTELLMMGIVFLCILFLVILIWNRTLRKQVEARTRDYRIANRELSLIFNNAPVGIFYIVDRVVKQCNPSFLEITGYDMEEIIGQSTRKFFLNDDDFSCIGRLYDEVLKEGKTASVELQLKNKNDDVLWCNLIGQAENQEDLAGGSIWLVSDITARKELEETLIKQAQTDSLTGIKNRRTFDRTSEKELRRSQRTCRSVSFLIFDLDHFKHINDRYGHAAGDCALRYFCRITSGLIRDYDVFGRVGGEEFALFMPETDSITSQIVAERIRKAVESGSIIFEDQEIHFTVSIGVTSYHRGRAGEEKVLLKDLADLADKALYEAKNSGRNQVKFHKFEKDYHG